MVDLRKTLRLLHTSDIHIGDEFARARRLAELTAVVDAAIAHHADALLIVGDFFDNTRVTSQDAEAALWQLARLTMPAIITNGNHDALENPSIYEHVSLADAGDHIHFIDDTEGKHIVLKDLHLTIWARAMMGHEPRHKPLKGYRKPAEGCWQVVLAHGYYFPPDEQPDRSSPILAQEIAWLGCDYLALGHWHHFVDVSADGVAAFYSGSPSTGAANLVILNPATGSRVERIPLAVWPSPSLPF
jgi:DNA repair exonuclease SbcCD nuclease subunit